MNKRILLVDDEPQAIGAMKPKLESWGYTVITASGGEEAIKKLKLQLPDLLLLDVNMSEKNGVETLNDIRKFNQDLPVVMLADFVTDRILEETKGLGVIGFVPKGYEFQRAAGLIRKGLQSYQEQRKVAGKGEKKRILIVDDEPELRKAFRVRLEANNYQVLTAIDGEEALNKAREERPDLIILDIMLPKMNGFKVCRLFKFAPQYKDIPVIMLTVRAQKEDKIMGMETGADEYLTKPFNTEELLAKVKEHLEKQL